MFSKVIVAGKTAIEEALPLTCLSPEVTHGVSAAMNIKLIPTTEGGEV